MELDYKPKVLIGVATGEVSRYANFYDYYNQLDRIEGTLHMFARGQSPAKGRNMIFQAALDQLCTHVLVLDDDVIPPPDTLVKLLSHDKPVVCGMYPMRNFPHYPVVFDKVFLNGFNRHLHLKDEITGLIPITNCGFGCVMIKVEVLKAMKKPWVTLGELEADGWCDDIAFFNKVYASGFEMYCDTSLLVDHMMTVHVGFRKNDENKWAINYDIRGQGNVSFPVSYPTSDIDIARRIEGWQSDKELEFIGVAGKEYNSILEIGSYKGKSTRAFADNTKGKVVCVDPWDAPINNNSGELVMRTNNETFDEFLKNLSDHIETGKVLPIRVKFENYHPNGFKPDFIFIDAMHDYESVRYDITKAMTMNPKVIAGHDYDPKTWPGLVQAVNERFPKVNLTDTIWWVALEG